MKQQGSVLQKFQKLFMLILTLGEIKIGNNFSLLEDFGINNRLVSKMIEKLNSQKNVYTIKFLTKTPELLVYEKTIRKHESTSNKQKKTYHIYSQKNK